MQCFLSKLISMRDKIVHICIKSDAELLHRVEDDYRCAITKMSMAAFGAGADIYAYSFMSNHIHIVWCFPDAGRFVSRYRNAYCKWFNHKYRRSGRLGERCFFIDTLDTLDRKLRAVNYVLRNPVHHFVSDTPFSYAYCSARYVFSSELCMMPVTSGRRTGAYVPSCKSLPAGYVLDPQGMVLPSCFLNVDAVENLYLSPKNYLYMINRPAYSDVSKSTDGQRLLQLGDLERGEDIEALYQNERRRSVSGMSTDMEVCKMIEDLLPSGVTYCQLQGPEKDELIRKILAVRYVPKLQLRRCFGTVVHREG